MSRKALAQHLADLEVRVGRTIDPLALLVEMSVGVDDYGIAFAERLVHAGVIAKGSREWFTLVEVDRDTRVDSAKAALKYLHEMPGKNSDIEDSENQVGSGEIRKLIASDEIAEAMENIQFKLAEERRKAFDMARKKELESNNE